MKSLFFATLLLCMTQLWGCAVTVPYGIYEDKRLTDTITEDKTIATSIKTNLLQADFSENWGTSVYCYYGHVFLVGEVPKDMQAKAVELARKDKGTRSVTAHWFMPSKVETNNFLLATRLRANLIGAKGVSSTRIDTQVNAGRVVLLGVVHDEKELDLVIKTARKTEGVKEVISYLMLPQ